MRMYIFVTSKWMLNYERKIKIPSTKGQDVVMPVQRKQDSKGPYYQWGSQGAKYHYTPGNEASRKKAKQKAHIQGAAAARSGYKGK